MASDTRAPEINDVFCKKCRNKVVSFVKCVTCDSCYHPSCAKNLKFVQIDKFLIRCCEENLNDNFNDDEHFFDAMEKLASASDNKVDIHIFKYILRQKDCLIFELRDKIKSLNEQLNSFKIAEQKPTITKTGESLSKKGKHTTDKTPRSTTAEIAQTNNNKITAQEVSKAIKDAEKHIAASSNVVTHKNDTNFVEQNWQQVSHKKIKKTKNSPLIGNYSGPSTIQGVEKTVALHVYNLKPNTSADDLLVFLRKHFPEATCTVLVSRNSDIYASFKVVISKTNYDKAMNASLWPTNACIRHFFQRKRSNLDMV